MGKVARIVLSQLRTFTIRNRHPTGTLAVHPLPELAGDQWLSNLPGAKE